MTAAPPKAEPGETQRNFTDPEGRILKTRDGYMQGYNAPGEARRPPPPPLGFNSLTPSTPLADLRELSHVDCCFRRINIIRLFRPGLRELR